MSVPVKTSAGSEKKFERRTIRTKSVSSGWMTNDDPEKNLVPSGDIGSVRARGEGEGNVGE